MQTETPNKQYTYEDYLKLDDNNQYEIIGGELILVPAPKTIHQRIGGELFGILRNFVRENNLGIVLFAPTDVLLTDKNKPQPDILFISKERLDIIKEQHVDGAPDLIVEITSPSTGSYDRVQKSKLYFTHGVKEYWIVDPDIGTVEVFTPGEKNWYLSGAYNKEEILLSPLLTGLQINLKDVFNL